MEAMATGMHCASAFSQKMILTTCGPLCMRYSLRPSVSPDGKYVAYVQQDGNQFSLWIRQTATSSNVRIVAADVGHAAQDDVLAVAVLGMAHPSPNAARSTASGKRGAASNCN